MPDPDISSVIETPFDAALSERYLVYALSTITARSLPDVRDGLKPVHRRLLWAMRLLRLDPAAQCRRADRRGDPPYRQPQGRGREPDGLRRRPGLPDRRGARR